LKQSFNVPQNATVAPGGKCEPGHRIPGEFVAHQIVGERPEVWVPDGMSGDLLSGKNPRDIFLLEEEGILATGVAQSEAATESSGGIVLAASLGSLEGTG
jgi:hypothetical protein